MKKDKTNDIKLLGTLVNSDESGIIANASQVYDSGHDKSTEDVDTEQDKRLDSAEAKDTSLQETLENITKTGEASAASNVTYNHTDSQLDASNVQQAIDEVYSKGNSNLDTAKTELNTSIQDVYKKSNYNDGDDIIDFNTIHKVEDNPEFIAAWTDAEDRLLVGIKKDTGSPYYGVGVPEQVKEYIDTQINKILGTDDVTSTIDSLKELEAFLKDFTNSDTLKELLDLKADVTALNTAQETLQADIDDKYKKSNPNDSEGNVVDTNTLLSIEDNPEYIAAFTDSVGKLIEAIGLDGARKFFAGIDIQGTGMHMEDNPEYIAAWVDSEDKLIFAIENDGNPYFGYGVPRQIADAISELKENIDTEMAALTEKVTQLRTDVDSTLLGIEYDSETGNIYTITGEESVVSMSMDEDGNLYMEQEI